MVALRNVKIFRFVKICSQPLNIEYMQHIVFCYLFKVKQNENVLNSIKYAKKINLLHKLNLRHFIMKRINEKLYD